MQPDNNIQLYGSITLSALPEQKITKALDGVATKAALSYGQLETVVSNSAIDRHGESILMEGIDTKRLMQNPVLLWAHDYTSVPIGRILKVWRSQGNLMARLELDYDIDPIADTIYKKILRGTISAVSIGGIVTEWNEDYTIIKKMEMIELSLVPVGAHRDALITSKQLEKSINQLLGASHPEPVEVKRAGAKIVILTI